MNWDKIGDEETWKDMEIKHIPKLSDIKKFDKFSIQQYYKIKITTEKKINVGLKFINGYGKQGNKADFNSLTTKNFKTALKKIYDDFAAENPEFEGGIDFDPIIDGQDAPASFEFEAFDEQTNYLTVRGKGDGYEDFKVTIKIVEENGKYLIDGCGVVNIPKNKRAGR